MPEHSIHNSAPRFVDAQVGSVKEFVRMQDDHLELTRCTAIGALVIAGHHFQLLHALIAHGLWFVRTSGLINNAHFCDKNS